MYIQIYEILNKNIIFVIFRKKRCIFISTFVLNLTLKNAYQIKIFKKIKDMLKKPQKIVENYSFFKQRKSNFTNIIKVPLYTCVRSKKACKVALECATSPL